MSSTDDEVHPVQFDHDGHRWLVQPLDGGDWIAAYRFEAQDGSPVIAEARVVPAPRDNEHDISDVLDPEQAVEIVLPSGDTFGLFDLRRLLSGDIVPPAPPGGLTARRLRTLHVSTAVEHARRSLHGLLRWARRAGPGDEHDYRHPAQPRAMAAVLENAGYREEVLREPRRPGSRGRGDEYYARIASLYAAAVERGSTRPAADVAAELGAYTDAYVRDVVSEARRRGLLTRPPRRGLPGGRLTDRARTALGEDC